MRQVHDTLEFIAVCDNCKLKYGYSHEDYLVISSRGGHIQCERCGTPIRLTEDFLLITNVVRAQDQTKLLCWTELPPQS